MNCGCDRWIIYNFAKINTYKRITMTEQNYKNHTRLVPGFHVITLGLIATAIILALVLLFRQGPTLINIFALVIAVLLGPLAVYARTFATGNQDRIIRCEENFRSLRLTGKVLDSRLTRAQIIALRFAGDEQFQELAEKAARECLSNSAIKQAIKDWRADHFRV
jgi:hypothetical protein